jgi:DNA primase
MTQEITAGGISVPLTHAGKVAFPDNGFTKEDLARYYASTDDPWSDFTSARHGLGEAGNRLAKLGS